MLTSSNISFKKTEQILKKQVRKQFFFFQSNSAHTYLESSKYKLSAKRKIEIVIKDFVIYSLMLLLLLSRFSRVRLCTTP